MNKIDLGQTISILANSGVIAGIVFLALELRQNNEHLAQEAQRSRAQSFRENMGVMADYAEIYIKDLNGETLTPSEAFRMDRIWMQNLWGYQTSFQQLSRTEIERGGDFFHRGFETMPSFRTTWEANRDWFQPDFVRYMEENVFDER